MVAALPAPRPVLLTESAPEPLQGVHVTLQGDGSRCVVAHREAPAEHHPTEELLPPGLEPLRALGEEDTLTTAAETNQFRGNISSHQVRLNCRNCQ